MTVTTSVTEGARWERHERGAGEEVDAALVSRILQLCRLKHMHNIVLSSLNLKKKRLLIVYSPASRCALFQQEKTVIIIFLCWQASLVKMFKYWLMSSRHAGQENFSPMTVMIDVQISEGEKLRPEMRLLFTGYQPPCWPKNFGI